MLGHTVYAANAGVSKLSLHIIDLLQGNIDILYIHYRPINFSDNIHTW